LKALELPESIAREALLLLRCVLEHERHGQLPEIPEISEAVGLPHDETSDLIDILHDGGLIKANRTIDGGAAPRLTGSGKLELAVLTESLGKGSTPAPPSLKPDSSQEPQEFEHSPDYRRIVWRGEEFLLSAMQSYVVGLLHEEFERGRGELGSDYILERCGSNGKFLRQLFTRHRAWGTLIIEGERKGTRKLNLRR